MTTKLKGLKIVVFRAGQKDEEINDVESFSTPGGNMLLLEFLDGSKRGIREFIDFTAEVSQ